jgi:two-component system nitrate/nitrite sensor histidine kinase NarX
MHEVHQLRKHTLYLRLLILLLCVAMGVVLIMAGSLFLVDYIPVSQSALKKINHQQLLWTTGIEAAERENASKMQGIIQNLDASMLDASDEDLTWLFHQDNPDLIEASRQFQKAQNAFVASRVAQNPPAMRLELARQVNKTYDVMAQAIAQDLEIKQSVISLLQLVALLLIMCCIAAIALGGRRVMVDRIDRLLSFIPDSLIEITPTAREDELSLLEQKLFGIMTRLEGLVAGRTWADQTSERLRRMMRAQEFLLRFVETVTHEVLSEMSLRKLLHALEKALNVNNAAVIFAEGNTQISSHQVVFSHHRPMPLSKEVLYELSQSGLMNFVELSTDRAEVRCLALAFSSATDAMDVLLIETERDRFLEEGEIQLLELTTQLLSMVIGYQGRDQEGRRIALLEERAAIARELHDSLAQSLSFMKIQIARLQSSSGQPDAANQSSAVIAELREGLDNAYRELRELLATFRVHMDVRGLGFAIQSAIDEFSQRSSLSIALDNRLINCRLTVNEEFHILHVVREALSNIVRHSGASNVSIALVYQSNGTVMVTIDDDGVGYKPTNDGQDHYGQAIMKERAYSLGGDIEVMPRRNGGTRVRLVFTPKLPQG